jgi:hypothetical protein
MKFEEGRQPEIEHTSEHLLLRFHEERGGRDEIVFDFSRCSCYKPVLPRMSPKDLVEKCRRDNPFFRMSRKKAIENYRQKKRFLK